VKTHQTHINTPTIRHLISHSRTHLSFSISKAYIKNPPPTFINNQNPVSKTNNCPQNMNRNAHMSAQQLRSETYQRKINEYRTRKRREMPTLEEKWKMRSLRSWRSFLALRHASFFFFLYLFLGFYLLGWLRDLLMSRLSASR
jgi:hypothetical protein